MYFRAILWMHDSKDKLNRHNLNYDIYIFMLVTKNHERKLFITGNENEIIA